MTIGDKVDQAIEQALQEAATVHNKIVHVRDNITTEADAAGRQALQTAQERAEQAREQVNALRERIDTIVNEVHEAIASIDLDGDEDESENQPLP